MSSPSSATGVDGGPGDRVVGVVVDLRALHDGEPFVEQADQGPDDPGLGLAPLTQQDDVVTGQYGVLELGDDGVVEAQHPGHQAVSPAAIRAMVLRRISSATGTDFQPEARRAPSVRARSAGGRSVPGPGVDEGSVCAGPSIREA